MFRILRYLSSGCIGVIANLGLLYIFADVLGVHYLVSSVLAVSFSTVLGFLLQKYWTFKAHSKEGTKREFSLYVGVAVINIVLNTLIVYLLVDFVGFHHLPAQFAGAATVAVSSYVIYQRVIFRTKPLPVEEAGLFT
jgi:dolichol-phosphate mannosyltransferase